MKILNGIIANELLKKCKTFNEFMEAYCPKDSSLRTCDLPFTLAELEMIGKYFEEKEYDK
jgi:hypothetical protein